MMIDRVNFSPGSIGWRSPMTLAAERWEVSDTELKDIKGSLADSE
jgi:hypothetical protein